jgi:hypothetical protein
VQFTSTAPISDRPLRSAGGVVGRRRVSTLGTGDHEVVATFSAPRPRSSDDTITQTVHRRHDDDGDVRREPATYGETVTFTVTVAPQPVAGSVQLSIDGAPVGGPPRSRGHRVARRHRAPPGVHVIRPRSRHDNLQAERRRADADDGEGGEQHRPFDRAGRTDRRAPLVLKATVTGSLSGSNPTGTVAFSVDGSPAGSPVGLSGSGTATLTMPAPTAGTHTATAEYSGDPEYASSNAPASTSVTPLVKSGYWMVGLSGSVYAFGDVPYKGGTNTGSVVDIEPTRSGEGYWIATSLGGVLRFGDAPDFGDAHDRLRWRANTSAAVGDPNNDGYWLFTDIGRVIPSVPHRSSATWRR